MFKYFMYSKTEYIVILLQLALIKKSLRLSLGHKKLSHVTILSNDSKRNKEIDTENIMESFTFFFFKIFIFDVDHF